MPRWRRVTFNNITDTSYNFTRLSLTLYSKRTWRKKTQYAEWMSFNHIRCYSLLYSHMCGRIRGYQFGATSAFCRSTEGIDSYYVDGISLTNGADSMHILTFAAGATEVRSSFPISNCPCDAANYNHVPAFI